MRAKLFVPILRNSDNSVFVGDVIGPSTGVQKLHHQAINVLLGLILDKIIKEGGIGALMVEHIAGVSDGITVDISKYNVDLLPASRRHRIRKFVREVGTFAKINDSQNPAFSRKSARYNLTIVVSTYSEGGLVDLNQDLTKLWQKKPLAPP